MKAQLEAFYYSLLIHGMKKTHCPKDWLEAFFMLELFLQSIDDGKRMVIFLDELPWMDTAKSGFITAFEGFWNSWGCHRNNLMVIVCGSANSWIMDKLINNHGGLYGRVTHEIKLEPFKLGECEACLAERNVRFSRYDIVQLYMIFGGIPYDRTLRSRCSALQEHIPKKCAIHSTLITTYGLKENEYRWDFVDMFHTYVKEHAAESCLDVTKYLASHQKFTEMMTAEKEEGMLMGFKSEIKGFAEGAACEPMMSPNLFIAYVFRVPADADADKFQNMLKEKADLAWNVCMIVDTIIVEREGDLVLFMMCSEAETAVEAW